VSLDHRYDAWHRDAERREGDALAHPWYRTVARLLPDINGRRVLEVGCGRGDFARWMSKVYPEAEITALDFSQAAIEIARARAAASGERVRFEVGDAQALEFEGGAFDVIVSCETLEHVPEPGTMAAEIRRVLTPGGWFVLTTENYFNGMLLAWLRTWFSGVPFDSGSGVQPHENFFLYWRVRKLLERAGLAVDHTESNHFQWLLLPRVNPASLCTEDFTSPVLKRAARPFGRHFTFCGHRAS
jgi:SAM-dependent methyltransferase